MDFFWPVRVYYEDTDAEGVVYYANYLRFFERARTEWLRACHVDLAQLQTRDNCIFVVASANVDFKRPARLNDMLSISVDVSDLKAASLVFHQAAVDAASSREICRAHIHVACVAADGFRPRRIPGEVREKMRCAMT